MRQQRLTGGEVEAATRHLPGGAAPARLLEEKDRNQVFAVGEQAIFKAYLTDGSAKQARKIAALEFLGGRGLPVPRLLGHGVVPKGGNGVPWTLETRVAASHVRPSGDELDTPHGWELHRALGRWLPNLHALGGFPSFGTWQARGPGTLAGHVLPRASATRARAAGLGNVPPALVRRASQELDRLEPAIRDAGRLRPRLLHGAYGTDNVAVRPAPGGCPEVAGVFDFESAAPGDPVEDFLWIADHGLDSRIFQAFLAGYLEHGQLDPGVTERFAFYQLEHCFGLLSWTARADPGYFAQALWLIEQELDGARLPVP
jgi:aminoglycoside phosphotransferase (APT) family kinase protein